MSRRSVGRWIRIASVVGASLSAAIPAGAQTNSGFMGFLSPTQTTVTAGDAASYMRSGTDWDQLTVVAGIAVPTLAVTPTVTTWRDATLLHFKFSIPDLTTKAGGATLACGDQVIIQIDQANAKGAHLGATGFHRYEFVIKNVTAPTISHRIPLNIGGTDWIWDAPIATGAAQSGFSYAGNKYSFEATIPLSEIGNPATSVGLAMAIVNDLGHSHGASPVINEATGIAFPIGMGLTHESDPGLSCGATVDATEGPTGNWVNPSTWGVAYFDTSGVAADVTLDQLDSYYISRSIKLGDCTVTKWDDMTSIPYVNWETAQSTATGWYKYHAAKPCRMGIWINAKSNKAAVANRRFLILWGVPNAGGDRDWSFVALTNPTAIASPATALSQLWDVPTGAFAYGHPCLRVYVLPANLTPTQITTLQGINSAAGISAMEVAYGVTAISTNYSAQMNFANMDTGACTGVCLPLSAGPVQQKNGFWDRFGLVREAFASQPAPKTPPNEGPATSVTTNERPKLIRIIARAFGVSEPRPKKQYVFIETIGGLGWAVPTTMLGEVALPLTFSVGNPALAEKIFVGGKAIEIHSMPRRILVSATVEAPKGVRPPTLDLSDVTRLADAPMAPGHNESVKISVTAGRGGAIGGTPGSRWWIWLLLALIIIVAAVVVSRRNP